MVSLNELCVLTAGSSTTTAALRQACALPRAPVDWSPLPIPHAEYPFDSAWEALFTGTDLLDEADD